MSALAFFRSCPDLQAILPTNDQFTAIVHAVKDRVEAAVKRQCAAAKFVSLAIDGWTDRRGRRYTGVSARCSDGPGTLSSAVVLAFKPITRIHDSGKELHLLKKYAQIAAR